MDKYSKSDHKSVSLKFYQAQHMMAIGIAGSDQVDEMGHMITTLLEKV